MNYFCSKKIKRRPYICLYAFVPLWCEGPELSWHGAYRKAEAFDEAVEQWVRSVRHYFFALKEQSLENICVIERHRVELE